MVSEITNVVTYDKGRAGSICSSDDLKALGLDADDELVACQYTLEDGSQVYGWASDTNNDKEFDRVYIDTDNDGKLEKEDETRDEDFSKDNVQTMTEAMFLNQFLTQIISDTKNILGEKSLNKDDKSEDK